MEKISSNLTEFCNSGDIYVISDLEGADIPKDMQDKKLIICGDLIDSTGGFDKESNKSGKNLMTFNLKNMLHVLNNPETCKLILGNRDVNKIKTGPMTMMKTSNEECNKLVSDFNTGDIKLDNDTCYKEYEKALKEKKITWTTQTKEWAPFWNLYNTVENNEYKAGHGKTDYWKTDDEPTFVHRFTRIFGADPTHGTMSAGNLLHTIPKELGLEWCDSDDKKAFVVLAVFRTMNLGPVNGILGTEFNSILKLKETNLNGLLQRLYKAPNVSFVAYANYKIGEKDYTLTFSHGGLTNNILDDNSFDNNLLQKMQKDMEGNAQKIIKLDNLINLKQVGGTQTICEQINFIQNKFSKIITSLFEENYNDLKQPSVNMLLIFALTAPYNKTINDVNPSNPPGISNTADNKVSTNPYITYSPINPGYRNLAPGKFPNVINIFGHAPSGFGTTLFSGVNNNYFINLDTSQSFRYQSNGGETINYLVLNGSDIKLEGIIDCSKLEQTTDSNFRTDTYRISGKINPADIKPQVSKVPVASVVLNTITSLFTASNQGSVTVTNPTKFNVSYTISQYIKEAEKINERRETLKGEYNVPETLFHGSTDSKYYLFALLLGRDKELLLLDNLESKQDNNPITGGNYEQKYRKYKQKYLQLVAYARANKLI